MEAKNQVAVSCNNMTFSDGFGSRGKVLLDTVLYARYQGYPFEIKYSYIEFIWRLNKEAESETRSMLVNRQIMKSEHV